ncbi:MAG: hypothetical protein GWN58_54410, partial [Anaerolineae bacterium]|nr:hypothetical protein [Anaerolineae bacterium]
EVEAVCNRVIILINGEIRADAHLADLEAITDVILILGEHVAGVADELRRMEGIHTVENIPSTEGAGYRIKATAGPAAATGESASLDLRPAIYDLAREKGWPLTELRRDARTLEAVFNELATSGGDER